MKFQMIPLTLTITVGLLVGNLALGANIQAAAPQATASKGMANVRQAKLKAVAKVKLVDINSASSAELQKLPGVNAETAARIIAGRPYGSKAWLVSHKVMDSAVYNSLRQQIIARQPNKDAAKNAALYKKK